MRGLLSSIVIFLTVLLYVKAVLVLTIPNPKVRCIESERKTLLKFKESYAAVSQRLLSSWSSEEENRDCCKWVGIECDNMSNHVVHLDLSPSTFVVDNNILEWVGKMQKFASGGNNIIDSLGELQHLNYLDLSYNDFYRSPFPSFIASLSKLKYLNLSHTYLVGEVPPQLANLSNLEFLDLSSKNIYLNLLSSKNIEWVSRLSSSLRILDLSGTNFSIADGWVEVVNNFPHLSKLGLSGCNLPDMPSSLSHVNSSSLKSLTHLDLSHNIFSVSIYSWLFNLTSRSSFVHLDLSYNQLQDEIPLEFGQLFSLEHLDLSFNQLQGEIPLEFGQLFSLEHLDLSFNQLQGEIPLEFGQLFSLKYLDLSDNSFGGRIPDFISNMSSLTHLNLASNQFNGIIPESVGQLSQLVGLYLYNNSFQGTMFEAHFRKLSHLQVLDLTDNPSLLLDLNNWVPPFQLLQIWLNSCKLGPLFPKWLRTQKSYTHLDMANTGISDSIPDWFWDKSNLQYLNLSNNQINGTIGHFSSFDPTVHPEIDLNSNRLGGSIPLFLFQVSALHLSRNEFSHMDSLCDVVDDVNLTFLDISYNLLSGELPDCWSHLKKLVILVLANNNLSGKVSASLGSLTQIRSLHLSSNNFTGELPSSLKSCRKLKVLDVGQNKLSGSIPKWIGEGLTDLVIFILRSNHFQGIIPSTLCHLQHLQLLDLSINKISGKIPYCLYNFTAMRVHGNIDITVSHIYATASEGMYSFSVHYNDQVELVWKTVLFTYNNILGLVKCIYLSENELSGEIPREIGELIGLVGLNLSKNHIIGQIPQEIGELKWLNFLDLSDNQLQGRIPSSLSKLDSVGMIDLSNNNLSGRIPTNPHLETLELDAFRVQGNTLLCGTLIQKKCTEDQIGSDEANWSLTISKGFYDSLGIGFVVGFCGFVGPLIFSRSWRNSYFKVLNDTWDLIFVRAALIKAKLVRKISI